jgi:hypothetical protein
MSATKISQKIGSPAGASAQDEETVEQIASELLEHVNELGLDALGLDPQGFSRARSLSADLVKRKNIEVYVPHLTGVLDQGNELARSYAARLREAAGIQKVPDSRPADSAREQEMGKAAGPGNMEPVADVKAPRGPSSNTDAEERPPAKKAAAKTPMPREAAVSKVETAPAVNGVKPVVGKVPDAAQAGPKAKPEKQAGAVDKPADAAAPADPEVARLVKLARQVLDAKNLGLHEPWAKGAAEAARIIINSPVLAEQLRAADELAAILKKGNVKAQGLAKGILDVLQLRLPGVMEPERVEPSEPEEQVTVVLAQTKVEAKSTVSTGFKGGKEEGHVG